MKINEETGMFDNATYIPSPNCDLRPENCEISLLVIHNISLPPGSFGGPYINQLFTNCLDPQEDPFFADICHLRVSSHLLIERTGNVMQFVPLHERAWHAGVSAFEGRTQCNDFSIGIELEGTDTREYEEIQYNVLAEISREILRVFPSITENRITGHSDIAPERKTDPGAAFDWVKYRSLMLVAR